MKQLIFFPTYNEAGNVTLVLDRISRAAPNADILVVDDSSSDGTLDMLANWRTDNLKFLVRPGKFGIGTAHLLAWHHALHHDYDILVTMDGDLSHDPAEIPLLLEQLDRGYDLVIGSRYMPGGRCDYAAFRRWFSHTANLATRLLLQIEGSEFTNSYRAFRVKRLPEIDFGRSTVSGYSFFFMTMVQAHLRGLRIAEVPIHFHNRHAGTSKIPALEILRGVRNLMRLTAVRYAENAKIDVRNGHMRCPACGCAYSKIVRDADANTKAADVNRRLTEPCLFCGDRGRAP